MVNPLWCGDPESRYVWCISPNSAGGPLTSYSTPESGILIDGLVMLDMRTGETVDEWRSESFLEPNGRTGKLYTVTEPTIVPKVDEEGNQMTGETDAYIVMIWSGVARETPGSEAEGCGSELLVFDAGSIGEGPRVRLPLPSDVPYGLHSTYVPWGDLRG